MPKLNPVSWKELIGQLRKFGFEGPYQSAKHPYMIKGELTLTIPNPHGKDIGADLLSRILAQAEIGRKEWLGKEERR